MRSCAAYPPALRGWLDAVRLKNVADAGIREVVPQIAQRTLDAIITPARILLCQAHYQFLDFLGKLRTSGLVLAALAIVPLLGHQ